MAPLPRQSAAVPWKDKTAPNRVPPRECIATARDALNRAYGMSEAPWPLIAEALDWQRRALEQMLPAKTYEDGIEAAAAFLEAADVRPDDARGHWVNAAAAIRSFVTDKDGPGADG